MSEDSVTSEICKGIDKQPTFIVCENPGEATKQIKQYLESNGYYVHSISSTSKGLLQTLNSRQPTITKQKRAMLIDNIDYLVVQQPSILTELASCLRKNKYQIPVIVIGDTTHHTRKDALMKTMIVKKMAPLETKELIRLTRRVFNCQKITPNDTTNPTMIARMIHENYSGNVQGLKSIAKGLSMEMTMLVDEWELLPVYLDYTCNTPGKLGKMDGNVKYSLLANKMSVRTASYNRKQIEKLKTPENYFDG